MSTGDGGDKGSMSTWKESLQRYIHSLCHLSGEVMGWALREFGEQLTGHLDAVNQQCQLMGAAEYSPKTGCPHPLGDPSAQ
jgi:hypothetical protein